MAEVLIEIFTEELPAVPLVRGAPYIEQAWGEILSERSVHSEYEFLYTPCRLVLIHRKFKDKQEDKEISLYGPPISIALEDGKPTKAALSFLGKNGITLSETTTCIHNQKEVMCVTKTVPGQAASEILGDMVREWLKRMQFGRSMRWGDCKEAFIRPIRNICILVDGKNVACNMFGVDSSSSTMVVGEDRRVNSLDEYMGMMRSEGVILDQEQRRAMILDQIRDIEHECDVSVEIDQNLLDEIVAMTQSPRALLGWFDQELLEIPSEVIITSMKKNQRYLSVHRDGKLINAFVCVADSRANDFSLIIDGNQKVIRARLRDAEFFYRNDVKAKLEFGDLHAITFMDGAGSLGDKVAREINIAQILCDLLEVEPKDINSALAISKNDLMSQVVVEFSELQGIMGSIYARKEGYSEEICTAIREQYLPHGEESDIPSTLHSAIHNLCTKLDTITVLFSLGKTPTGSKDPFALRRQATALLRMCERFDLDLELPALIKAIMEKNNLGSHIDTGVVSDAICAFIKERFYSILSHINPSIVRATLKLDFGVKSSFEKIRALHEYFISHDIRSFIGTFKRVANVLNDVEYIDKVNINPNIFSVVETKTYRAIGVYKRRQYASYTEQLEGLSKIKEQLDKLFETTLINVDDKALRFNRLKLIRLIEVEFLAFGDLREISI